MKTSAILCGKASTILRASVRDIACRGSRFAELPTGWTRGEHDGHMLGLAGTARAGLQAHLVLG